MRSEKRIAVLAVVQNRRSPGSKETGLRHSEKSKHRSKVWLYKVVSSHLRLRAIRSAGSDDKGRSLADDETLGDSARIAERLTNTRDLVDPQFQHRWHTE